MSRYDQLLGFSFPEIVQTYSWRDTILYALGVGAGDPPDDAWELRHVYERGLVALPTMVVVLAHPGNWYRSLAPGLDHAKVVHASERLEIHNHVPSEGTVITRPAVVAVHDKGDGRGSLVVSRRTIIDYAADRPIATVTQTAFCRGDGGLGGPIVPSPIPHVLPLRAADVVVDIPTSKRSALVYRLSGDDNPLHADPAVANAAGFRRPILHGLATHGHIGRAILKTFCADGSRTLRIMDCRFTSPVFPGETLTVMLWQEAEKASFKAHVGSRVVVDNGFVVFGPQLRTSPHSSDA